NTGGSTARLPSASLSSWASHRSQVEKIMIGLRGGRPPSRRPGLGCPLRGAAADTDRGEDRQALHQTDADEYPRRMSRVHHRAEQNRGDGQADVEAGID